jgi:hypothetical protein
MPVSTFYPGVGGDDYYFGAGSEFSNNATNVAFGDSGLSEDHFLGIRFSNITIPKDALISSAKIRLTAADTLSDPISYQIFFNEVDNATAPTSYSQASGLVLTSSYVSWPDCQAINADWGEMEFDTFDTPELKTLLQAIVNRAGWVSGNAVQIVIKTGSSQIGIRSCHTIESESGAYKPQLIVDYFNGAEFDFETAPIAMTLTLEGELESGGYLNQELPGLTCEGTLAVRSGTLDEMLPGFLIFASGGVGTYASLDKNLPGFLIEARSGHFADITLAGLLAEGTGLAGNVGSLGARSIVPLPGFVISASGKAAQVGSLVRDLPGLEISAHGYAEVLGRLDRTLAGLSIIATGLSGNIGNAGARSIVPLPGLNILATGFSENRLSADLVLPGFFITAEGWAVPVLITCLVMNPKNLAISEYTGINFNSFAFFNGKYLAAGPSGIHVLEGDTDNGEPIISLIKTGHIPTGSARARDIYLMGRSDAQMRVTLIGDEEEESREEADYLISKLGEDRVVTPRGMDPVYLQIAVENSQGGDFDLDSIQVFGEGLKRRSR